MCDTILWQNIGIFVALIDRRVEFFFSVKRTHSNVRDNYKGNVRSTAYIEIKSILKEHYYLHCKTFPVMKTGFSLCSISNREKPVFINLEPCNENKFFPVWKYYTGNSLFWSCTGPVRDCSVAIFKVSKARI